MRWASFRPLRRRGVSEFDQAAQTNRRVGTRRIRYIEPALQGGGAHGAVIWRVLDRLLALIEQPAAAARRDERAVRAAARLA